MDDYGRNMQSSLWGQVKFAVVIRHSNGDIKEAFQHELVGAQKRSRVNIYIRNYLHVEGIQSQGITCSCREGVVVERRTAQTEGWQRKANISKFEKGREICK